MSTLSFFSVTTSAFLPLSKATNWNRIIWRVSSIWVSILSSNPYKSSGSWTQALQVMQLWLNFVSAWSGRTVIVNGKNDLITSGLLWECHLCWFSLLLCHEVQTAWSDISMVFPRKLNRSPSPFSPRFSPGIPYPQNDHIRFQPLWRSLLLLLKWTGFFSCKTCVFH